jgi:hypothetical protein
VRLLLDSHVPVALVQALARAGPDLDCVHLRDWQARRWLNAPDPDLLSEAAREGWTLVTYDLRTIVRLLRRLVAHSTRFPDRLPAPWRDVDHSPGRLGSGVRPGAEFALNTLPGASGW